MYTVYISDHLWNPITQLFNMTEIEAKLKLNDISSASFSILTSDINSKYAFLSEFNKIKICRNT